MSKWIVITSILLFVTGYAYAVTWNSDGSLADVQSIHNNFAANGDTITIPNTPGVSYTWSGTLTITKAITLQGSSTADPHCGGGSWANAGVCKQPFQGDPPPGTHVDNSKIIDNQTHQLIQINTTTGALVRITGISFLASGANPQSASVIQIGVDGNGSTINAPTTPVRVDHCYFGPINVVANIIWNTAYNYGVFDHNVSVCEHGVIQNGPGRAGDQGDAAFENPVNFGGPQFFFVEDNWIKHGGDIVWGGKTVFRYNHLHGETTLGPPAPGTVVGAVLVCHGTGRQGNGRGGRAYEVYSNDFHWNDSNKTMDGSDTGSAYWYNNTFDNNHKTIGTGNGEAIDIACYRMGLDWNSPYFTVNGIPGQTWDLMATESDGTHVDNHSTFVFASGVLTAGSNGQVTFPGSPGWITDQWQGYVVRRSSGQSAGITGNNANTLFLYNVGFPTGWSAGQTAEIVKPLNYLDQCGRGWGGHINRASPAYPGSNPEPLYSFNNVNLDNGQNINYNNADYLKIASIEGIDYFQNTQLPGYVPYCYPHPLVSGNPCTGTPTPTPTASPTATATATATPTATPTSTPTATPTATATIAPPPVRPEPRRRAHKPW